jgi:hypothetical protein
MAAVKTVWYRLNIFFRSLGNVFKSLGGTLTAVAVAVVGIHGSDMLDRSRARDSDVQLYAQLMSKREDAETLLRKDMFNSIIGTFLKTKTSGYAYEQQVLNLELLAYNFHEALDLAPLFKHVFVEISDSHHLNKDAYMRRLERVAGEVKSKQIAALEESGGHLDASINLDELKDSLAGVTVIDGVISPHSEVVGGLDPALQKTQFKVEVLSADKFKKEIRIKLEVTQPKQEGSNANAREAQTTYSVFTVSPFDFPMIDNTRLPHGQRCAVVIRNFGDPSVAITLVYFPGSRASLKEKPFYDEAMHDLLYTRTLLDKEKGK